ncbi:MAG: hypothetical protein FWB78_08350 [Treponema sp.]|nr:hypothetical protein [Treponema sp.]
MKKLLTFIIAASLFAAPTFAFDFLPDFFPDISLSAGGGGIFNTHWYNDTLRGQFRDYSVTGIGGPSEQTQHAMRQGLFNTRELVAGGGIYAFFDATLVTLGVGLVFNSVGRFLDIPNLHDTVSPYLTGEELHRFRVTQLNLSLMFRYPFELHERWAIFPMLGIDGQIALGDFDRRLHRNFQQVANRGYDVPTHGEFWNALWIRFGGGADFALTGNLFLRGELLYGFKINSVHESRMAGYWERGGVSNGLHVRIGVGYTFWRQ